MKNWLTGSFQSLSVLCLAGAMVGCDGAPEQTAELDETSQQPLVSKPLLSIEGLNTVTWLGDSITHHAGFTQYLETFFVTRFPQREWQFFNRGVAGDRAADALARYADDPEANGVQLTVVQLGMNDGGYRRWREETGETFERDLLSLIDGIQISGGGALLISPTVYDVEAEWRDQLRDGEPLRTQDKGLLGYDSVIERLSGISGQVASGCGVGFVDVRTPLLEFMLVGRNNDPAFSVIPDSLHPSADGNAIMAVMILRRAFFQPDPVSGVTVSKAENGVWQSQVENAELLELPAVKKGEATPWSLKFSLKPKALPWLVPGEAEAGFAGAAGGEFNRESLRVSDLESGEYLLTIESFVAGTFSAAQLAEGIEVGKISGTPQRVQAAEVAELNRLRNQGPVRSRQDWQADFKNRMAALSVIEGEAEKQAAQSEFDLWKETHRQALIDLDAEDEKLWTEIREAAQPKALRYELRRLPDGYRAFGAN